MNGSNPVCHIGKGSCTMITKSSKRAMNRFVGLLAAFSGLWFAHDAQATIVVLIYQPQVVSGGSFVDPNLPNEGLTNVSFPEDRLSFTVGGNYSVLADGSSSTVEVTILTEVLTSHILGSYNVNTSADGFFAYSSPSPVATAPQLTQYSVSSQLLTVGGFNSVALPSSPVSLPVAGANFPTGGLEQTGSSSSIATVPPGFVFEGYLEQLTTIKVDNVVAGETIDIHLPNTTSLTSAVPEPGSLALLGIGLLFKCGVAWQRKRGSRTS